MIAGLLPAVMERLRRAGERARAILVAHRAALQAIAHQLDENSYLSRGEIEVTLSAAGLDAVPGIAEFHLDDEEMQ